MASLGSPKVDWIAMVFPFVLITCRSPSGGGTVAVLLAFLSSVHLPSNERPPGADAAQAIEITDKNDTIASLDTYPLPLLGCPAETNDFKKSRASLLNNEIAGEQSIDSGREKAADSVARRAYQRIAEQVETGVVQNGKAGRSSERMQQAVIERVVFTGNRMYANKVVCHRGSGKRLAVRFPYPAHRRQITRVGPGLEVFARHLSRNGRGEFTERLPALDEDVQVLGGIRVQR